MNPLPELVCPVGNMEKLITACHYGADAVYLGGQKYGLRSGADNFSKRELEDAVNFASSQQVKVYVVLNAFLHESDLVGLPEFVVFLEKIGVHAVIVSDLGVIRIVREHAKLPIHLSTQASCMNRETAKFWKDLGVKRIVVGRELSIAESSLIKNHADIEIEMFIHGAMCSAYSGQCTISNYTAGRDSNRGGCKQSCRFDYTLDTGETTSLLSSSDLNGIELLDEYASSGIDALKVEGRMKSEMYLATVTQAYRMALDALTPQSGAQGNFERARDELENFPHRPYTVASLKEPAKAESVCQTQKAEHGFEFLGKIVEVGDAGAYVQLRHRLDIGDRLEVIRPAQAGDEMLLVNDIRDFQGSTIPFGKQEQVVLLNELKDPKVGQILRWSKNT